MSAAYIRAIRGPVLLITIGVLMLADQQTSLGIGTTWPILLVVAGLMVLAERASIRENPWAAPGGGSASAYAPPPPPPSSSHYSSPTGAAAAPSAFRKFGEPAGGEDSGATGATNSEGGPQL